MRATASLLIGAALSPVMHVVRTHAPVRAGTVANAIRDATGADVTSLPITREEILRALREAEARGRKEPVAAGAA